MPLKRKKNTKHPVQDLATMFKTPLKEVEVVTSPTNEISKSVLSIFLDYFEYTVSGKKFKVPVFLKTKISTSTTLPHLVNVKLRDKDTTSSS